jgi:hypothetical protein
MRTFKQASDMYERIVNRSGRKKDVLIDIAFFYGCKVRPFQPPSHCLQASVNYSVSVFNETQRQSSCELPLRFPIKVSDPGLHFRQVRSFSWRASAIQLLGKLKVEAYRQEIVQNHIRRFLIGYDR